jgi:hypothetical protein
MKKHKNSGWAGLAVAILAALGLLGGCSSDSVAPHEDPPALTARSAAGQAGAVALAVTAVAPQVLDFAGKSDKDAYSYTFPTSGDVQGTVHMAFFQGGAGGTPVAWSAADYGTLATATGEWLNVSLGEGGLALLSFDVAAALDRPNDQATVNGSGFFASGPYSGGFQFDGLVVGHAGTYPGSGTMTYTGGAYTMTVTFDGSSTATIVASGGGAYVVDLDTGIVTPVTAG